VVEHLSYSTDLAPCEFYLFPRSSQCSHEPVLWRQKVWKQNQWRSSTAFPNMTGIAVNIGSIVWRCVSTEKGTILKAIVIHFLNLLNRRSYRHAVVFLVLDQVEQKLHEDAYRARR
jgi:hypothetical protein